jgi:hypothetical protein
MDRMNRIKANDECGMMNDELKTTAFCFSFIIPHSSFIILFLSCLSCPSLLIIST